MANYVLLEKYILKLQLQLTRFDFPNAITTAALHAALAAVMLAIAKILKQNKSTCSLLLSILLVSMVLDIDSLTAL